MDKDSSSHDQDILEILRGLESKKADYPPELLAARRKLFIEQLEKRSPVEEDRKLIDIFRGLKALEPEYPPERLARRRSLLKRLITETSRSSIWQVLRASFRNTFTAWPGSHGSIYMKFARASALALGIAMFAVAALAMYGTAIQSNISSPPPHEIVTSVPATATSAPQAVLICKDGAQPPLCLGAAFETSQDLTDVGNGKARPAVAKDAYPGSGQMHHASYVNDGVYGPGASWVSNSANSWIKIDLGTTTEVNTIAFGRDRLGNLNDGDPGRFIIALATADNVYANGNSSNDEKEYVQVYDSKQAGFNGKISGAETVVALFEVKKARFIKIVFENPRTAIDEVQAFVSEPTLAVAKSTKVPSRDRTSPDTATPLPIDTALPVNTPLPTDTATAVPIDTLPPTDTVTAVPTDPPTPVDTPTPIDTPLPIDPTIPPPSETPVPLPGYTPIILPTDEPIPTEEPASLLPDDEPDLLDEDGVSRQ